MFCRTNKGQPGARTRSERRLPAPLRQLTAAAIVLAVCGTGTAAAATQLPSAQLVYQTPTGAVNTAHVDAAGNVAVNDSAASGLLASGNSHLASIDSGVGSANGSLSTIAGRLGGTIQVGGSVSLTGTPTVTVSGTAAVTSADRTVVISSGTKTIDPSNVVTLFTGDVSAYRTVALYIDPRSGGSGNTCEIHAAPANDFGFLIDFIDVSFATGATVRTWTPAPPVLSVYWFNGNQNGVQTTVDWMLVGRSN